MHELLFGHQRALGRDDLVGYAAQVGLDGDAFAAALVNDPPLARIEDDITGGIAAGVHGTPTLFLDGVRHHGHDGDELTAALTA
jgi:2-hydroxychromene-2-carboxylate isomerase